jgi:hypothetical protein
MTRTTLLAFWLYFSTTTSLLAQTAPAQTPTPEPEYPIVRVGVLSYLQYAAELENRNALNSFDVTRAYLNINAQVMKNVRFRITPDIRRVTDGSLSGSLTVRMKYAFAQFDNLGLQGSWARFGLHQTPWLDFEEGINRYRVQGTMFPEREGLIPGSADFGASYFVSLPHGWGEVHGGVFNGEGFTQPEANKYKSGQGRLTIRPFANRGLLRGVRISGFYNAGWYADDRPRRLGIVMGSYEHPRVVATIERLKATDSPTAIDPRDIDRSGWSMFVEPRQGPSGLAGIFRYDAFRADQSLDTSRHHRVIAGAAYWFVRPRTRVGFVVTNERVSYDAPERLDENRFLFQTHIEF